MTHVWIVSRNPLANSVGARQVQGQNRRVSKNFQDVAFESRRKDEKPEAGKTPAARNLLPKHLVWPKGKTEKIKSHSITYIIRLN